MDRSKLPLAKCVQEAPWFSWVRCFGAVALTSFMSLASALSLAQSPAANASESATSTKVKAATERLLDGGLRVTDHAEGSGPEVVAGKAVAMTYSGWLYDSTKPEGKGKPFDSNVGKTPFGFILGAKRVIAGWEQGVLGMKAGGKRTLIIPPSLGYGDRDVGNGLIPAGSTLIFDVELIKFLN